MQKTLLPVTPPASEAVFWQGFLDADISSRLGVEMSTPKFTSVIDPLMTRTTPVEQVLDDLTKHRLTGTQQCIERFYEVAQAHDRSLTSLHLETSSKMEARAHRDDIPVRALSFIVVASGIVDYTHGGRKLAGIHTGGTNNTARVGDVLCLNNMVPYRRRPLHALRFGVGKRFILDFVASTPNHITVPSEY